MFGYPFLTAVCLALAVAVVSLSLAPPIHHNNPPRKHGTEQSQKEQDKANPAKDAPAVDIKCDPNCAAENTDDEGYPSYAAWLLHKAVNDPIAGFTGLLVVATLLLAVVAGIQISDARVIQRAFISVEPGGTRVFEEFDEFDDNRVACDIIINNTGSLAAHDLKWAIERKFSANSDEGDFDTAKLTLLGNIVVGAKVRARKGTVKPATKEEFNKTRSGAARDKAWLYVWGRISYHDGFKSGRYIDFCHRYNLRGVTGYNIPAKNGRYHEHGNRTDDAPES